MSLADGEKSTPRTPKDDTGQEARFSKTEEETGRDKLTRSLDERYQAANEAPENLQQVCQHRVPGFPCQLTVIVEM